MSNTQKQCNSEAPLVNISDIMLTVVAVGFLAEFYFLVKVKAKNNLQISCKSAHKRSY